MLKAYIYCTGTEEYDIVQVQASNIDGLSPGHAAVLAVHDPEVGHIFQTLGLFPCHCSQLCEARLNVELVVRHAGKDLRYLQRKVESLKLLKTCTAAQKEGCGAKGDPVCSNIGQTRFKTFILSASLLPGSLSKIAAPSMGGQWDTEEIGG